MKQQKDFLKCQPSGASAGLSRSLVTPFMLY